MDLKLNRRSQLPIHVQLRAQLAHMIEVGQLEPGAQLPTVRQLAGYLRINRNTVSRVFADLEREGYLSCEPGRGTFVCRPGVGAGAKRANMAALLEIVHDAMERARRIGFSPAEFSAALYAEAQAAPERLQVPSVPVLFVECNRPQLELFGAELTAALPVDLTTLLLTDLVQAAREAPEGLQRYRLAATTFFHVREVQALLAPIGLEVVGLLAEANLETLLRLTALPDGSRVGIACHDWSGVTNLALSIRNAGLAHIHPVLACEREADSLRRMLEQVSVVVCSSLVEEQIRRLARPGTEIIVEDRRLDPAGIELLRRRLAVPGPPAPVP